MNLKLFAVFSLLLLPLAVPAPAMAQGEKPVYKLGLLVDEKDQDDKNRTEKKIDAEVLNAATDAFLSARRFKMIERNQLSAVFTEKSLQDFIGGRVNNKLSDVLDLDLVGIVGYTVETSKSETTARWIIDVRLIDVKTASLLTTITSDRASFQNMLPPASPREASFLLAQGIREAFPPLGYVVKIDGKDIMIDLGSEAGLKEKDTLEIVQEGEKFPHPVTGELLSSPLKVVGELKVVSASPQVAICRSKRGGVQMGNIVRLKGTESAALKWLMRVPRVIDEYKKKRDAVNVNH